MKRFICLNLMIISSLLVFSQNNIYVKAYNVLGTNTYNTGMYSASMYGQDDAVSIFFYNYDNHGIIASILVANSQNAGIDNHYFKEQLILSNNWFKERIFSSQITTWAALTNNALVICSDCDVAIYISTAVLNSRDEIRESVYKELFDVLNEMKKGRFRSNEWYNIYSRMKTADPLLILELKNRLQERQP